MNAQPKRDADLGLLAESDPLAGDDLRAYFHVLKRKLPHVLIVALACTALAAMRTYNLPVVYAAGARLQLAKEAPDPTMAKSPIMYWEGLQQQYVNTQIHILSSGTMAKGLLQAEPDIAKELEAELGTGDPNALAGAFLAGVRVLPVQNTYLVDVSYNSTDEARCPRYANALALAYLSQLSSRRGDRTKVIGEKISKQTDELFKKLDQSETALKDFLKEGKVPLFEQAEKLLVAKVTINDGALSAIQRERIRLDAELEAIARVIEHGRPLESAPSIASDEVIARLRSDLASAQLELATIGERYGPEMPQVKAASARRDMLKLHLSHEIETSRALLQSTRDARVAEEQGLLKQTRQLKTESRELSTQKLLYQSLVKEVDGNRRLYEEFSNRLEDLEHWGEVNITNASLVDEAIGAYRVSPNHLKNVALGLAFGLALGVLVVLVLERLTDRLRTLQEASSTLQLPALGVVPEVTQVSGKDLDRYALTSSRSVYAEAFRRARVQLNAVGAYPSTGCGVLVCSSGLPREGKTLCAVNMAVAEAQAGKKTLLIDGDMRNPRVHKVFDIQVAPGLAEALADPQSLHNEGALQTDVPNLWVLPAGQSGENPAETLAKGEQFAQLVARLRARFDRVVVDTPPVAAVSDGTLMAPHADCTLLVVSAKASSRTASMLARTELARVGCGPVGLIFNQQEQGDSAYYYSYYQRYYTEPQAMPPAEPPA